MTLYVNPSFLISTFFGLGRISKKAPGTVGSIAAIPVSFGIMRLSRYIESYTEIYEYLEINSFIQTFAFPLIIATILFFIGSSCAGRYAKMINDQDPKEVVMDEVVGLSVCILVTLPITLIMFEYVSSISDKTFYYDLVILSSLLYNFILFRVFDILKPWPISYIDTNIKGGIGIMLDDLLAAIFTIVIYFATLLVIADSL